MTIHPEISAALMRERTRTFLAEAEAARRSRPRRRPLGRPLGRPSEDSLAGLRCVTGVDHRDHEALGALDHARGGGVGIARQVREGGVNTATSPG